jgi:RsiW-degrading membrane proteinase PrsW (M82 family)
VIIFLTGNAHLIPTVVLLGSFLVAVTFVAWAFERRETGEITGGLIFSTFVTGGVLGILGASVLESFLLHPSPWLFFGVGLIEEAVKLGALMVLARRLRTRTLRDGMILGAAVGFGFAAFESAANPLRTDESPGLPQRHAVDHLRATGPHGPVQGPVAVATSWPNSRGSWATASVNSL